MIAIQFNRPSKAALLATALFLTIGKTDAAYAAHPVHGSPVDPFSFCANSCSKDMCDKDAKVKKRCETLCENTWKQAAGLQMSRSSKDFRKASKADKDKMLYSSPIAQCLGKQAETSAAGNQSASTPSPAATPAAAPAANPAHAQGKSAGDAKSKAIALIKTILTDNDSFAKTHDHKFFEPFQKSQAPRATVVMCCDSRIQTDDFEKIPENDIFVARNIGNQLATTEGSIEYGVEHLNTPVLIFIGHTACGAVTAASGDYSKLSEPIQRELKTLALPKKDKATPEDIHNNMELNVHNQVQKATTKFADLVKEGKLMVIGMAYDFENEYKIGEGRLIILNVNGKSDPDTIAQFKKEVGAPAGGATQGGTPSHAPAKTAASVPPKNVPPKNVPPESPEHSQSIRQQKHYEYAHN